MSFTIHTIGHSTRSLDELVALLKERRISVLADVRRFPGSRRHPHFNAGSLQRCLGAEGITYAPFPALGGRRKPLPRRDSLNNGWKVEGFRGYADYMLTEPFASALHQLMRRATEARTAFMCAEAVPWRCHRSLIADVLVARGWTVFHITGGNPESDEAHTLRSFAVIDGYRVIYPTPERQLPFA